MKTSTIYIVMAMLCLFFKAEAQSLNQNIRPLKIGDTLPDEAYKSLLGVVNQYKTKKAFSRSNFDNEKLFIIDFWATWCSSCIKKLPKLFSLQKNYAQNLKVVLVNSKSTKDDNEKITRFLNQRKEAYQFPSIVEDTIFNKLFPHTAIPHYCWIMNKKVVGITDAEGINSNNVEIILRGGILKSSQLKFAFDPNESLHENRVDEKFQTYIFKSVLATYSEGLKRRMYSSTNSEGLITKLIITNSPIMDFYRYSFPILGTFSQARIIFDIKKPSLFATDSTSAAWKKSHTYSYEAFFPPCSQDSALRILAVDLEKFFGYRFKIIERDMSCWVLKVTDYRKLTNFPKTLKQETNLFDETGLPIFYNNSSLQSLVFELERIYREPFIDETNLKSPVTLSLPAKLLNPVALQSSLSNQGVSLTKETRKIQVVILSEK